MEKTIKETSTKEAWIYLSDELFKQGIILNLLINFKDFEKRYKKINDLNNGYIDREYMPTVSYKKTDKLEKFIKSLSESSVKDLQFSLEKNFNKLGINFNFKKFIEKEIPSMYILESFSEKDKIKTEIKNIETKELKPIQNELFLEKVILNIKKYGIPSKENFITKRTLIISKNNFILDGHHRWITSMIFCPELELEVLKIKMTFEELYPILMKFNN